MNKIQNEKIIKQIYQIKRLCSDTKCRNKSISGAYEFYGLTDCRFDIFVRKSNNTLELYIDKSTGIIFRDNMELLEIDLLKNNLRLKTGVKNIPIENIEEFIIKKLDILIKHLEKVKRKEIEKALLILAEKPCFLDRVKRLLS